MRFLLMFLALLPVLLSAKVLRCDFCHRQIRGRYISVKSKNYCSKNCFERTLPKCELCRKPLSGTYKILEISGGEKVKLCLRCAELPRCFSCERPAARIKRLSDGRFLCSKCESETLSSEEEESLFNEIRKKLENVLGRRTQCPVKLRIVNSSELKKISAGKTASGNEIKLGTCYVQMKVQTRNGKRRVTHYDCTIYLLSNMPRRKFIDAAAHELAHHWQHHEYPFLRRDPLRIPEGFAEYAASIMNIAYGQPEYNLRKEKRRDPVYGDGYRFYRNLVRQNNKSLSAVFNYMKRNSSD